MHLDPLLRLSGHNHRGASLTGCRAFTREVLETPPLGENPDDFMFDNKMLAQAVYFGFRIGEIS
jgi:hypothetical protein